MLLVKVDRPQDRPALDGEEYINPESAVTLSDCLLEPGLSAANPGDRFQFVRHGYFITDEVDSKPGAPVFNRIVGLKNKYRPAAR